MGLIPAIYHLVQRLRDPDKEQREALQQRLLANPDLMKQLANSAGVSGDPSGYLRMLGIRSDSEFGRNFQNQLSNTPISEVERASRLKGLEGLSVNDPSYAKLQNLALQGLTPEQKFEKVQQAFAPVRVAEYGKQMGNPLGLQIEEAKPQYLSADQEDIYNKFQGLPTKVERQKDELDIKGKQQSIATAKAEEDALKAQLTGTNLANQLKGIDLTQTQSKLTRTDATKEYLKNKKLTAYQAYRDPNTPILVKQGIFEDEALKEQFEADATKAFHDASLELQKESLSARHDADVLLNAKRVDYASKVGDLTKTDPKDVLAAMQLGGYIDQYADPSFKPTTPEQVSRQRGAIALKTAKDKLDRAAIAEAYNDFRARNARQFEALESEKNRPDFGTGQAIVQQINADAQNYFGQFGIKPPKWDYSPKYNKGSGLLGLGIDKEPVLGFADPGDPILGVKESKTEESKIDEEVNNILTAAQAGQVNLEATIKDPRTPPEVRKKLLEKKNSRPQGK